MWSITSNKYQIPVGSKSKALFYRCQTRILEKKWEDEWACLKFTWEVTFLSHFAVFWLTIFVMLVNVGNSVSGFLWQFFSATQYVDIYFSPPVVWKTLLFSEIPFKIDPDTNLLILSSFNVVYGLVRYLNSFWSFLFATLLWSRGSKEGPDPQRRQVAIRYLGS